MKINGLEKVRYMFDNPIIAIADLGLWHGRVNAYKIYKTGIVKELTYGNYEEVEWFIDEVGDLRSDQHHHDGTNHVLYRMLKPGVTDRQLYNLCCKITSGNLTRQYVNLLTKKIGYKIRNLVCE